ncbi:MAG: phosphodiester glycosidase family protein [Candidatus Cybelea sp.]
MRPAIVALLVFFVATLTAARSSQLPARIDPSAPFPQIVEQAPSVESVAPGITYAEYQLDTVSGPISVHVVVVEPHRSDLRLDSVLAGDSLVSRGETIGSMARRTRAVAGINADFFDIGNTNRPVNMVVRDGTLLQLPYKRYALAVTRDGRPHIAEFSFVGQIVIAERTMPLDAIDGMPRPEGGLSLLTPAYGRVAPQENVTLVSLAPTEGAPPLTSYRVTGVADNLSPQPPGYYVAIGPSDYGVVGVPDVNSTVTASGDLAPFGLASMAAAVGGGALILHDGQWYDDPDAPYPDENSKRTPSSGAAIAPDGRLFLIEIDGRQPELSVGVTRRQFSALMRSLGATEGLLFDGGGSSTLVVRRLGDADAGVVNSPSDGKERPVADGLFVYSTAPTGPAVRLVARPGVVRAINGAEIPLRVAAVDAAYHVTAGNAAPSATVLPSRIGIFRDGRLIALAPGSGHLILRDDGLTGDVPIEVDAAPARSKIAPARANVDPNATIALQARAYDARGYALALPAILHWTANTGSIDGQGRFHAASRDATVTVRIGTTAASTLVTVGSHEVALPFADRAYFLTARRGGAGQVVRNAGCQSCVRLTFSFGNGERAAYAHGDVSLPPGTIGVAFDVQDDGSEGRVRVSVRNEINEDVLLDATQLGAAGWRRVTVRFPTDTQATRLTAIYVLPPKGVELSQGSIVLRNVRAIVAGQSGH